MNLDKDTVQACWDAINTQISHGPLLGNGCDQTAERNGLIIASNIINNLFDQTSDEKGQATDEE